MQPRWDKVTKRLILTATTPEDKRLLEEISQGVWESGGDAAGGCLIVYSYSNGSDRMELQATEMKVRR